MTKDYKLKIFFLVTIDLYIYLILGSNLSIVEMKKKIWEKF